MRKSVAICANRGHSYCGETGHSRIRFFAVPVAIEGDGRTERVIVERTQARRRPRSITTGETYVVPGCAGRQLHRLRTPPIEGVHYEHGRGRFANSGVGSAGLYCVGWARRAEGTIGTKPTDGYGIVELIAGDRSAGGKLGPAGLDALLAAARSTSSTLPLAAERSCRSGPRPPGSRARSSRRWTR